MAQRKITAKQQEILDYIKEEILKKPKNPVLPFYFRNIPLFRERKDLLNYSIEK